MNNYLKKISEIIEEDKDQLKIRKIRKIKKKAETAINLHIADLKYKLSKQEDVLEAANEELIRSKYPDKIELVENVKKYIKNISEAEEKLRKATKEMEKIKENIKFYEDFKKEDF